MMFDHLIRCFRAVGTAHRTLHQIRHSTVERFNFERILLPATAENFDVDIYWFERLSFASRLLVNNEKFEKGSTAIVF